MKLALIAGTGALPFVLFQHLAKQEDPPIVCAMQGFEPELKPNITFRIEHLGSFLQTLVEEGVTHACMAGAVRRPDVDPAEIDEKTAPLVSGLQAAMGKGDDGALRWIISLFEDSGFTVIGAAELMPELLPPTGVLTKVGPNAANSDDAKLGDKTMQVMGAADTGQACLIKQGKVISREGPSGTDAMILSHQPAVRSVAAPMSNFYPGFLMDTVRGLLWWRRAYPKSRGAILFKAPKPGQDRRADLPVIGPETARNAVAAKLAGIVVEDGGVMVLDLPQVRRILDSAGLFLWVRQWD